ncbi:hypothetical protein C8F01DRAFT_3801 [Mycena amicta]|nr:hypothetical protein C8F01DRAFT_3801 [Mycena amicta]
MDVVGRIAARARLSGIEEKIERPGRSSDELASLRAERDRIREGLDQYKYPVLTLPNEMISEIFIYYLPPYPDCPPLVGPGSPTLLLGICRLWREIALHSPLLWRAISLGSLNDDFGAKIALTWLERSGPSTLLSFEFSVGICTTENISEPLDRLLQALIAYRSRWQYGYFHVLNSHVPLICGPAPHLVSLDINCQRQYRIVNSSLESIVLRDTPCLRSICMWDVGYGPASLPWSQLTDLTLLDAHFPACAASWKDSPNLLRCKLVLTSVALTADRIHIRLPRLATLILETDTELDGNVNCLTYFTLPSLRRLEIATEFLGGHDPVARAEQLQSFIAQSHCPLQRLRIIGDSLSTTPNSESDVQVVAFRAAFPHLDIELTSLPFSSVYDNLEWKEEIYWNDGLVPASPEGPGSAEDFEDREHSSQDSD